MVFGDMNAHIRSLSLDAHKSFMPHISRMQEDMQYSFSSVDEKDPNRFGKLVLQMCNNTTKNASWKWCILMAQQ